MRNPCRSLLFLAIGGSLLPVAIAHAYDTATPMFPDPGYSGPGPVFYNTSDGIRNFRLSNPSHQLPPPSPGGSYMVSSFFDVFTELTLDGGQTWTPVSSSGDPTTIHVQNTGPTTYQTEMLQLDLSGGSFPGGVRIRESPTLQSTGQTTITDNGNGTFRVDSFFDVFTELSVDGGNTWIPAQTGLTLTGTPEPASLATLAAGSLFLLARRRRLTSR